MICDAAGLMCRLRTKIMQPRAALGALVPTKGRLAVKTAWA